MTCRDILRMGAVLSLVGLAVGLDARRARTEEAPAARAVVITTGDGSRISATFHPSGRKRGAGVVLVPMYRSTRSAWDPVLAPLHARGVSVLTIDLRGQGSSAALGAKEVVRRVEARDPTTFAAMHHDAIAAVRWLAQKGGCDPQRIVLVGASVGGAVALDAAARHAKEVAGVLWLSPGSRYLGLDAEARVKALPPTLPLMLVAHRDEAKAARALRSVRPTIRLAVHADPRPTAAGAERAWAHGTRMFGRIALVEQAVASFVAVAAGSKRENVVLDGIVTTSGPDADPWEEATPVGIPGHGGSVHAIRVGRRILFGGVAPNGFHGLAFEVQTGDSEQKGEGITTVGPPQIVGADLRTSRVSWSFGGMGSAPRFPGVDLGSMFGQTQPVFRAVATPAGTTFEGEWVIPTLGGESQHIRLCIAVLRRPPEGPRGGGVVGFTQHTVDLPSR